MAVLEYVLGKLGGYAGSELVVRTRCYTVSMDGWTLRPSSTERGMHRWRVGEPEEVTLRFEGLRRMPGYIDPGTNTHRRMVPQDRAVDGRRDHIRDVAVFGFDRHGNGVDVPFLDFLGEVGEDEQSYRVIESIRRPYRNGVLQARVGFREGSDAFEYSLEGEDGEEGEEPASLL